MKPVFVFGSNLAGRHGKGAALSAVREHGARYGLGIGYHGNSYAIPTKDANIKTLPLRDIKFYVDEFLNFAKHHPELTFNVTKIGCGLAGYSEMEIAPLFNDASDNCKLPPGWRSVK